ncbi:M56 family metallopeptidase [Nocardioides halotolerans]|jgi:Zn-dependent protease with chaperone function|uniref:M56 family metallopeptidase n=1 Tax=Nocardioides halotolerans TaxID=433660 RepID=UPI000684CC95|nr:M56 family metallopeptidase [Nocardioides halotolerans]
MITLLLLGFTLLVFGFARLLVRSDWAARAPAWGIWVWQTTSVSAAISLVLAGVVVAVPATPLRDEFAALLRSCSHALAEHYEAPGGLAAATVGLTVSVAIAMRFGLLTVNELRIARRRRTGQRQALALVGVTDPRGFDVVEHNVALVYCLPGRSNTVVVTRGAMNTLSSHQLDLVLAHERRHLRVRHHLALSLAAALSRTFYGVGVFGLAHQQIGALAEMQADDAVRHISDRQDLARALVALSPMPVGPALGASGSAPRQRCEAAARIERLSRSTVPMRRPRFVFAATLGALVLAAPVALALSPAVEGTCCSTPVASSTSAHGQGFGEHPSKP